MCQICRLHFWFDAAIIKQKDARFQARRPKGASRESGEPPFLFSWRREPPAGRQAKDGIRRWDHESF
jgi:hypothetical protein